MLCWLSSWYGCHIAASSASHPAVCGEKQFVSCSPTPSALHRLLLFHHRKVMLRSPQSTLVWEDGMHLSVHARVSYSRTILIWKQAEQNNKSEQDRASVCLNQQAIFLLLFLLHYFKCSWEDLERDENENVIHSCLEMSKKRLFCSFSQHKPEILLSLIHYFFNFLPVIDDSTPQ